MSRLIKALIAVIIVTLLLAVGVYAYQVLWSGKARITIEPPAGSAKLELTRIWADRGIWDGSTNTWTVSIPRGSNAALFVEFKNTGGDVASVGGYASNTNPASGVTVTPDSYEPIPAGGTNTIGFLILVSGSAVAGQLPEIQLELRQQ